MAKKRSHGHPNFSGRRNNEAGYIEDTIIKDSEGCLKELPYTCVLYLPDKGSCRPIKRNSYESYVGVEVPKALPR